MEAMVLNPMPLMVVMDALSFFSRVMREYSLESEQLPYGALPQYGISVPAGGQKYTKLK